MENVILGPPSSGSNPRVERAVSESSPSEVAGAVIAALSAVIAVTLLVAWGLGMAGALAGPALGLYAAQVASGVVIALGFCAHAVAVVLGKGE